MHNTVINLEFKTREVSENARLYGATIAAEQLQRASLLLSPQWLDSLRLDLILRLLDPSLLEQEIEVATLHKVERWYTARNILLLLLSIFTFLALLLVATIYLGWWTSAFRSTIILILLLSIPGGFVFISLYVFSLWRIHWLKHRSNQVCTELSLKLQDIIKEFLLSATESLDSPRNAPDALSFAAEKIQQSTEQLVKYNQQAFQRLIDTNQGVLGAIAEKTQQSIEQLVKYNQQAFQRLIDTNQGVVEVIQNNNAGINDKVQRWVASSDQVAKELISTNQSAVQIIQGLNTEVKIRVGAFDEQITPALLSISKDISVFQTSVHNYQQQLVAANDELVYILRQLSDTNISHLHAEQNISAQIQRLNAVQQDATSKTELIVATMSNTAQSVINIADRLAHQQRQSLSETRSSAETGTSIHRPNQKQVFDVFLCYSNEDRLTVEAIAQQLKARGIIPWLDEWEIRPGVPWQRILSEEIPYIKSVAVFIGQGRSGPWLNKEMRAILREFVRQNSLIIPVILPECEQETPELPAFLGSTTWVDFRQKNPSPLEALSWGITGRRVTA